MRDVLNRELKIIHEEIIQMSTMLEKSIEDTVDALVTQNGELAQKIIDGDDVFDKMERDIEAKCVSLIATQQPVAIDLRTVFSAVKIVTDLERMADHCQDISRITLKLCHEKYVKPLVDLPLMAKEVKLMAKQTVNAFIDNDLEKAKWVCENDDIVDQYFEKIYGDLVHLMENKCENIEQCMMFLMISKYFERMADHSTNISEWVIYNVKGKL